ncbi:hypothetical protein AAWP21_00005, partial [Bacillus anthracis]|uniref:hypothetical protein n=1 Tax=Bacillus anthracis TaxID=1392 RepID=UPI003D241219
HHVRFDEGKLKQKRDGKATPKENIICFSFLLYHVILSIFVEKIRRIFFLVSKLEGSFTVY